MFSKCQTHLHGPAQRRSAGTAHRTPFPLLPTAERESRKLRARSLSLKNCPIRCLLHSETFKRASFVSLRSLFVRNFQQPALYIEQRCSDFQVGHLRDHLTASQCLSCHLPFNTDQQQAFSISINVARKSSLSHSIAMSVPASLLKKRMERTFQVPSLAFQPFTTFATHYRAVRHLPLEIHQGATPSLSRISSSVIDA